MHPTRRITTTLGATALAISLLIGLTACRPSGPPKGQADIKVAGSKINGATRGPRVTCSSTSKVNTRVWNGTVGGKSTEVRFEMDKVTGRDGVTIFWSIPGGISGFISDTDKDIISVGSDKVARFSGKVGNETQYVTLTAALACP